MVQSTRLFLNTCLYSRIPWCTCLLPNAPFRLPILAVWPSALQNGRFRLAKWAVLSCKTGRLGTPFGPYRKLKRTVWQAKSGRFAKALARPCALRPMLPVVATDKFGCTPFPHKSVLGAWLFPHKSVYLQRIFPHKSVVIA